MNKTKVAFRICLQDNEEIDGIERFLDWEVQLTGGKGNDTRPISNEDVEILQRPETDKLKFLFGKFNRDPYYKDTAGYPKKGSQTVASSVNDAIDRGPVAANLGDIIEDVLAPLQLSDPEQDRFRWLLEYKYESKKRVSIVTTGFTCDGVVKSGDVAIKVDDSERLKRELEFYKAVAETSFAPFTTSLYPNSVYSEHDGIGFLSMKNIDSLVDGWSKWCPNQYGVISMPQDALSLMRKFHNSGLNFTDSLATYEDLHGIPHHVSTDDPGINHSGARYRRFKATRLKKGVKKRVERYQKMLLELKKQGQLIIIDGDWKKENIYRGYKIDFSCVGLGLEIDDGMYYLSDADFELNPEGCQKIFSKYYLGEDCDTSSIDSKGISYIISRDAPCIQLASGPISMQRRNLLTALLPDALLRQLVLRHSVMKKRDLMNDKHFKARQFYQHRANEVLKGGKFI
jgi:hypothetical protein